MIYTVAILTAALAFAIVAYGRLFGTVTDLEHRVRGLTSERDRARVAAHYYRRTAILLSDHDTEDIDAYAAYIAAKDRDDIDPEELRKVATTR